ncbi:MAG: hypothetical protein AAB019_07155 [Planctomycetota bacterium]
MKRNQIVGIVGLLIGILGLLRALFWVEDPDISAFGMPAIFCLLGVYYIFQIDKYFFGKNKNKS